MKLMKLLHISLFAAMFTLASGTAFAKNPGPTLLTTSFGSTKVIAWSWGASNPESTQVGGGIGSGKAVFQDVSITRLTDALSAEFLTMVANGSYMPEVLLTRGNMTIALKQVLVTSYSIEGTSKKKEPNTENITLNFTEVKFEVDGSYVCWDVLNNAPGTCD